MLNAKKNKNGINALSLSYSLSLCVRCMKGMTNEKLGRVPHNNGTKCSICCSRPNLDKRSNNDNLFILITRIESPHENSFGSIEGLQDIRSICTTQ